MSVLQQIGTIEGRIDGRHGRVRKDGTCFLPFFARALLWQRTFCGYILRQHTKDRGKEQSLKEIQTENGFAFLSGFSFRVVRSCLRLRTERRTVCSCSPLLVLSNQSCGANHCPHEDHRLQVLLRRQRLTGAWRVRRGCVGVGVCRCVRTCCVVEGAEEGKSPSLPRSRLVFPVSYSNKLFFLKIFYSNKY